MIQQTLYPLWDLGLDVSCSSRSIDECLKMAKSDVQVKTGLMDARYLDGNYDLFRTLRGLFTKKILHRNVRQFAETLARDLHLRHQKYEDPAYVLEPNIKEGKGGLRDFQVGRWIIKAKYQTDRWDSILFPDQSRTIDRSLEFLLGDKKRTPSASAKEDRTISPLNCRRRLHPFSDFQLARRGSRR